MTKARECGEKVQYRTRRAAQEGMWLLKRQTLAIRLNVYRCRFCGFWHYGHTRRRRR
jgi:hypothetical protein